MPRTEASKAKLIKTRARQKKREALRQQKAQAKANTTAPVALQSRLGGSASIDSKGEGDRYSDNGLTKLTNARLIKIALEKGWARPPRGLGWPVHLTLPQIEEIASDFDGHLPGHIEILHSVVKDARSHDPRFRAMAARGMIAMQSQNLSDMHHEDRVLMGGGVPRDELHGIAGGGGVTIYLPDNGMRDMTIDGTAEIVGDDDDPLAG